MARIKLLSVRLSAGEFLEVCRAAAASSMAPASWTRHQALRAAESTLEPVAGLRLPPPASPSPNLTNIASTRFTEEQFEALVDYSRACGLPLAAFIRQVVLGVKPIARRPELRSAIVAVNRVGNNLNQLVKLAHTGVVLAPELVRVVREVLVELHALQKALLRADTGDAEEPSA
jgi:Bacterial mobilisation protein (MobC)